MVLVTVLDLSYDSRNRKLHVHHEAYPSNDIPQTLKPMSDGNKRESVMQKIENTLLTMHLQTVHR